MSSWHLDTDGLTLELAPRRPAGPLIRGRYLHRLAAAALQIPAAVLILGVLVVPATATVITAAETRAGAVILLACAIVVAAAAVVDRLRRSGWRPGRAAGWASAALLALAATTALLVHPPGTSFGARAVGSGIPAVQSADRASEPALSPETAVEAANYPFREGVSTVGAPGVTSPPGERAAQGPVPPASAVTASSGVPAVEELPIRSEMPARASGTPPDRPTAQSNSTRDQWSPPAAWLAAGVLAAAAVTSLWWPRVMRGRWLLPVSAIVLVVPTELLFAARQRPGLMVWSAVVLCVATGSALLWRRISPSRSELALAAVPAVAAAVAGMGVVAVGLSDAGRQAYAITIVWVLGALGVLLPVAVWAAWGRGRRRWWPWWPLVVPFGISAFVAGLAFRLIFEPPVDAVGGVGGQLVLYAVMLGAAFVWTWFGALFVLLRAAVDGIAADPVRSAYLHERTGARRWLRLLGLLDPVLLILGLVVAVAAARIFDVVLIAVPGPGQYVLNSATVHWWRLTSDPGLGQVGAEAYSLPLAIVVGLGAWLLQSGTIRHRTRWPRPDPRPIPVRLRLRRPRWASGWTGRAAATRMGATVEARLARFTGAGVAAGAGRVVRAVAMRIGAAAVLAARAGGLWLRVGVVALLMLSPLAVLAAVSWFGPDGAALTGPESVWRDDELWQALLQTAWVAGFSTLLTVTAALPPAYYAAALDPDGRRSRLIVVALVVLAVMPAQMYVGRIRAFVDDYGLAGTSMPLILTHAALGLPIAILILRGALLSPPDLPADAGRGPVDASLVLRRVGAAAGPALVAVAVLQLVQVWNDFFVGLLVSGADASPWSLLLWSEARQFHENVAHLAAGALLSAVPPVVLLLATWRRFLVPGLTGGVLR
ncbi:hypothetical protein NDR87_01570 [Nocardia sp. CDC159]|uniref:Alpha-glucoside transport system permease protein n=1 Tax=Nocardia pulmonis TaxID=2951408 RepID=A0A9X2IWW6_9NOCA|nr:MULTISPECIES: hypothetical protein [Nocardia]MCM6772301.1 hypothetical protein [Nocardia pulmonis]MCM6785041.1 hypothetical protein [Nocardia sp. CDC159]